jgi:hypothetical protein
MGSRENPGITVNGVDSMNSLIETKGLLGYYGKRNEIRAVDARATLRFQTGFMETFFRSTGRVLLMAAANSAMVIGLSLVNPAWVQKSSAYMINMQLIAFLAMGSLFIPDMVFHQEWLQVPMAVGAGLVMLYMEYWKLSNME